MAIDKVVNFAPTTDMMDMEDDAPDIEIILEDDGSAVVEIGDDGPDIDFYGNLAEVVDEDKLGEITIELQALFDADKTSRGEWETMYAKGLQLLGLKIEERTKPFRGASGVVHPMLTEAIVQFQAQAFKELMPAGGPVRTQTLGTETVDTIQQACRVQDFMNYQITTVMKEYTPEFDQLLFYTGYGGSCFKKVYYDEQLGRMVSRLVLPDDLYIPYNGSSVMSECQRITHRVHMDSNEFRKRVFSGEYLDEQVDVSESSTADEIKEAIRKVTGIERTAEPEEIFLLEFHVNLDLPGFEDCCDDEPTGIKLPYVVTIDETSGKLVGLRRNWIEGDKLKKRREWFVHYVLVEGLGAYGLGFVHLIGGLSQTATGALRQLLDAGTFANLPAGFKTKGARIANENDPFQPGEWRDMDAGGAELASSLMPLPYKEPSQTLFQLLGFAADAGKRLASTANMQVGDGNQQAAVGTTIALLERGSQVMSAIHKRLYYAQTQEFEMLADGFGKYLPDEYPYSVPGASRKIKKCDFNNMVAVLPVADPNIFSAAQRITLAQTQLQLAQSAPQMHNMYEAYYRVYAAMNVRDIEGILRTQSNQMPKDSATENADVLDGMELKAFAGQQHDSHIASHIMMGLSPIMQGNPAAAATLFKHLMQHLRIKAEEDAEAELFAHYGSDPDRMISEIQREGLVSVKIAQYQQEMRLMQEQLANPGAGGSDPVVALKEQELAQRAAKDKADIQIDEQQLVLEKEKMTQTEQANQERILGQQKVAQLRAEVARERLNKPPTIGNGG
tara:strand:+ start:1250 stop:3607 length:2358 start_codon:yes stop_codon:yes gene_type:complete